MAGAERRHLGPGCERAVLDSPDAAGRVAAALGTRGLGAGPVPELPAESAARGQGALELAGAERSVRTHRVAVYAGAAAQQRLSRGFSGAARRRGVVRRAQQPGAT